ncbi:hypothetical protein [Streptomyces sp. NPDC048188]
MGRVPPFLVTGPDGRVADTGVTDAWVAGSTGAGAWIADASAADAWAGT